MFIPVTPCARAIALTLSLAGTIVTPTRAAVLSAFDFEDALGNFDLSPELQHSAVASATLGVAAGTLTDFSGNPGRALALNNFVDSNRITLELAAAGAALRIDAVSFDVRVSPSGPPSWHLEINGVAVASGASTTSFTTTTLALPPMAASNIVHLALVASGASSAQGTLRLDNLIVEGSAAPVPLPAAAGLVALPLAALSGPRRRPTRARHRASGNTGPA